MRRLASALVLVLALAALAAGCGGDDSSDGGGEAVEPATWASGFCNALKTFSTGISEAGSDLTGQGIPSSDEIISVIDNAAAAASTFADDLREPQALHEANHLVHALAQVARIDAHHHAADADRVALVLVRDLGDRDVEALAQAIDHGAHHLALVLERVRLGQLQLDEHRPDQHAPSP